MHSNKPVLRIHCPSYFDGTRHHPEGATLVVQDGLIVAVESLQEPGNPREYWCPGWVNTHAHLELSDLAGKLPTQVPFPDWLNALRHQLETWQPADFRSSYLNGLRQAQESGTTTLYDVGNAGAAPAATPGMRLFAMPEVLGLRSPDAPPAVPSVPHALYSTHPSRILQAIESCFQAGMPWSIHLGESLDEQKVLCAGSGPFRPWLDQRIPGHPFTGPGPSPLTRLLDILEKSPALNSPGWIVHGNYLDRSELEVLARHPWPLVHCPQSREWFGHPLPDFAACRELGVDVCVATDSLASASSLDLRDQLRTLRRHLPGFFTATDLLAMITAIPGRYLGGVGRIAVGAPADLVCLTLPETTADEHAPEAALDHHARIHSVWHNGQPTVFSKDS